MSWSNTRAQELRERAKQVIPGGMYGHQSTMLLPVEFPQFFARGKGARLWDADGNEYVDFLCGYGPNLLGYGFEPVEAAAAAQQVLGDTMTGPSEIMVDLAEAFVAMVSHADWAMFCNLSPYHNMFLSSAHTEADIARALEATDEAFRAVKCRLAQLEPHPIAQLMGAAH